MTFNSNNTKIKAIIFDFDLTVARTLRLKIGLLWHYAIKYKVNIFKLIWKIPKFYGMSLQDALKYVKFDLKINIKITDKLMADYRKEYKKRAHSIKINSPELFNKLRKKHIKIGIVSNEPSDLIKYNCKNHRLNFDLILDTVNSSKSKKIKETLKHFKVKPNEAIYVGDHPNDIKAGKSAGVKTIAMKTILQSNRKLKKEKPDYLIHSLTDILKVINN